MANETNIAIRCEKPVKDMFNAIAEDRDDLSKVELFEQMIKAYTAIEMINTDKLDKILKLLTYDHEYLGLLIKSNKSVPTNVAVMMKMLNEEPMCDKYIRMKLGKEK